MERDELFENNEGQEPGREATRDRLITAALQVFAEKGYYAAGVEDIVRASDTSKGAFYFHFPNKRGIFLFLLDQVSRWLEERIERAIAGERSGLRQLEVALRVALETFSRYRPLARLLMVEAMALGHAFDPALMEAHDRFTGLIQRHLDAAVGEGSIPPQDTALAAVAWFGALQELVLRWLYTGQPDPLTKALPGLYMLLLHSVGRQPTEGASAP
jgi:TetR/AcrR family fatty acid metabolism transcriptional regulator